MLNRLMMTIRSNIGDLVSRAEDPEKMLGYVITEMQSQLVQAKQHVAVVIADEHRLRRQADEARRQSDAWERRAMLAIRAGDDNLARAALGRKSEHDELAGVLCEQWQAQRQSADALRSALRGLSAKIEDAHRQRRILIARHRRAEAQRTIAQTLSSLNASSPLSILDRMESRVAAAEADAEALADLAHSEDVSLEAQFRALEAANVDDQLAALTRRMALGEAQSRPRALNPASN